METATGIDARGAPSTLYGLGKGISSANDASQQKSNYDLIPIYTDWANHHLQKGQKKRVISDLQKDMQDSVLLAEIVEAVTGEIVPDVKRKPKNAAQVVENIGCCLQYLSNLGVNVEGLTAKDIRDGQLKAILSLFFSLSRYKQQQKASAQQQQVIGSVQNNKSNSHNSSSHHHSSPASQHRSHAGALVSNDMLTRLPSPFRPSGGQSVAAGTANNVPVAPPNEPVTSGIPSLSSANNRQQTKSHNDKKDGNVRENSIPASKLAPPSGLKAPGVVVNVPSATPTSKLPGPGAGNSSLSSSSSSGTGTKPAPSSGLKPPSAGLPAPKSGHNLGGKSNSSLQQPSAINEDRMLEKLKLFGKDKTGGGSGSTSASSSPRVSTSSSKSSARGPPSACTTSSSGIGDMSDSTEGGGSTSSSSSKLHSTSSKPCSPKMTLKSLTKKTFASGKAPAPSPKTVRKEIAKTKTETGNAQTSPMVSRKPPRSRHSSPGSRDPRQGAPSGDTHPGTTQRERSPSPCATHGPDAKGSLQAPKKKTEKKSALAESAASASASASAGGASKLAIPKPTMAVKGTTKPAAPVRDESTRLESVVPSSGLTKPSSLPKTTSRQKLSNSASCTVQAAEMPQNQELEKERLQQNFKSHSNFAPAVVKQQSTNAQACAGSSTSCGLPAPIASTSGTAINPMSPNTSGAVIGVVSPITHHKKTAAMVPSGGADLNSSLESTMGHQSDSNSSHTSGNQSDAASVIYCPSGEEGFSTQRSNQAKVGTAGRSSRTGRVLSPGQTSPSEAKLREMSASTCGRTQSRLETTFYTNDGVIVTTETMAPRMAASSDEEEAGEDHRLTKADHRPPGDFCEPTDGCCGETGAEEELATVLVEPMAPLLPRSSPYAYLKNYAGAAPLSNPKASVTKPGSAAKRPINPQEQLQMAAASAGPTGNRSGLIRAKSPRLLLNKPLATLLHADPNGDPSSALQAIRHSTQPGELLATGYVSDGDALALASAISASSHPTASPAVPCSSGSSGGYGVGELDISGYMSEGGISLYARKMQARFREGLEAVRDSMREKKAMDTPKIAMANFVDDSCEDSSSLSSGISEAFDEISTDDLTGSSLSDHAAVGFYPSSSSNHKRALSCASHHLRKECGQQTDYGEGLRRQRQPLDPGGGHLKKLSDQYDRQKIDVLLQKSRTNARGQAAQIPPAAVSISGPGVRPKSEQMSMMMNEIQLSADGQTLRVSASNFGYPQQHPQTNGKRTPLATNSLKLIKTDFSNFGNNFRPDPYAQRGPPAPYMAGGPNGNGYHSLDRKKHLLSYHDVDPSVARYYYSDAESLYVNYANVGVPRTSAGATLALVSPRRVPQGPARRAPGMQQQQQQYQPPSDTWARHSIAGNHGKQAPLGSAGGGNNNNRVIGGGAPNSMSRSMIEPEIFLKPGHHQMSVAVAQRNGNDPAIGSLHGVMAVNENVYQHCVNGHARLSVPPPNVLQPVVQSPRLARCASSQTDNGLRKDRAGDALSPSSQLYVHKLLANSPTSAANVGMHDGLPPSPGSMSDRGVSSGQCRPGHLHSGQSPYATAVIGVPGPEEVHASSLSLASTSSSVYSTAEEKYQTEIRKLQREVDSYREKVQMLTTQQATYTHVLAAFEQALQSITKRMQTLSVAHDQKDTQVVELRRQIDTLRQLSATHGINVDEVLAGSPSLHRRHTFTNNGGEAPGLSRQMSAESMQSAFSQRSSQSGGSGGKANAGAKDAISNASSSPTHSPGGEKKQKKSWTPSMEVMQLRSSFSKAFGKGKSKSSPKGPSGAVSDAEDSGGSPLARRPLGGDASYPNSPLHSTNRHSNASGQLKPAGSLSGLDECGVSDPVDQLRKALAEKDTKLTDVRLEALTSAHQVDQLQETVHYLKVRLATLQTEKEQLQRALCNKPRAGSQTSLPLLSDDNESVSECSHVLSNMSVPISADCTLGDGKKEAVRLQVSVWLDFSGEIASSAETGELLIGSLCLTMRAKWDLVDTFVFKLFKEYVLRIDPVSNLGLSAESIVGYRLGNCERITCDPPPNVLPGEFLRECIENEGTLKVALRGIKQNAVDSLAFDTLIPKSIVQRYVQSLVDDRRVILCSHGGTGKTYLARKLAHYLVVRSGKPVNNAVISFDGGDTASSGAKAAKAVKLFFESLRNAQPDTLPVVVILDNLHNMGQLNDVFASLTKTSPNCPYIIGTLQQNNHCTTTLQLQHNFRWHPCANHSEPIKGFLGRYLRRRLVESEVKRMSKQPIDLCKVLDWLPKVWIHLNKYLEVVNSSEASIGPAQFLDCPLDLAQSRQWFIHLWNTSLSSYIREKATEGLQLYQKRASLEDPYEFILQTWPWSCGDSPEGVLLKISSEEHPMEYKFDSPSGGHQKNEYLLSGAEDLSAADPLMMLLRLEQSKSEKPNDLGVTDVPLRHAC